MRGLGPLRSDDYSLLLPLLYSTGADYKTAMPETSPKDKTTDKTAGTESLPSFSPRRPNRLWVGLAHEFQRLVGHHKKGPIERPLFQRQEARGKRASKGLRICVTHRRRLEKSKTERTKRKTGLKKKKEKPSLLCSIMPSSLPQPLLYHRARNAACRVRELQTLAQIRATHKPIDQASTTIKKQ